MLQITIQTNFDIYFTTLDSHLQCNKPMHRDCHLKLVHSMSIWLKNL